MASRDIVHQMTDEMGMNQQMLQSMQQQQMTQMPMPAGMQPPASVDFSQLSPEQQMMMMQQAAGPQPQYPPQGPMNPTHTLPPQGAPHHQDYDDSSSASSSSSGSSGSINLDKLGLGASSNSGWLESLFQYLKYPLVVIAIFVIISLPWIDSILKPMIPYGLAYGTYYLGIKGLVAGALFLVVKLVV
jgi:hypothetical protein